jgi:hypothetical protein
MPTTSGGVDEEGFFFLLDFNTKSSEDMEQLRAYLRDPESHDAVETYDNERVTLKVRPSSSGFGDDW